jgi:hypothetical protein
MTKTLLENDRRQNDLRRRLHLGKFRLLEPIVVSFLVGN